MISTVEDTSPDESHDMLIFFQNNVTGQLLQAFLGYDPQTKDGSYVKSTIIPGARLDS